MGGKQGNELKNSWLWLVLVTPTLALSCATAWAQRASRFPRQGEGTKGARTSVSVLTQYLIGAPGDRPDLAELPLHLLPRVAGVLAGVDFAKEAVGEKPIGIGRVDGEPVQR